MSRSPFKMATVCHKFQFDFIFAKLELILANPLAKVSIVLTVGSHKPMETQQRPKASKETILKETLSIVTSLYEDPKKGTFQEKFATIEVILNNSKVSNVIGTLKLDLANYAHSTGEKLEMLVLQKSPEYQGKILLGVNSMPVEATEDEEESQINNKNFKTIEPNDSVSQRELSDTGHKSGGLPKRSLTPNLRISKNPATEKLMHMVDRVISKNTEVKKEEEMKEQNRKSANLKPPIAGKLMNLFSPILSKTNDVLKEYTNDEKAKLEKVIFALRSDKQTAESRIFEHEKKVNEQQNNYEEINRKFKELEKENYKLKLENEELKLNMQKEKQLISDLMQGDSDKLEIFRKIELSTSEQRIEEIKRVNEKLLEEKYKVENDLVQQKKMTEEEKNKVIKQIDENSTLKREIANQNEFINKKERQIKSLIDELNRGKEKGTGETFIEQTEKIRILEQELKKQDEELTELRKNVLEKTKTIQETKTNLDNSVKEAIKQKNEIENLKEKIINLETIMEIKDNDLKNLEELQLSYVQAKQHLADIVNLAMECGNPKLIEDVDRLISP